MYFYFKPFYSLTFDTPMLIPNEIPINNSVTIHTSILLIVLCPEENPMFSHLIYSGSGAFEILTSWTGKSLSLKYFHKLNIETTALLSSISSRAFECRNVTKIIFFSYRLTLGKIYFSNTYVK